MQGIKQKIQNLFNKFGYEVKKIDRSTKFSWLSNEDIKTVLDIGANVGQFRTQIHSLLPNALIYSFEPIKSCFDELKQNTNNLDRCFCYNIALGEDNTQQIIYRNDFTPSSSMLPLRHLHIEAFPRVANVRQEIIEVRRLDDFANTINLVDNILIKIDVQGFKDKVMRGGANTIKRAKILIVETSFEPLYQDQLLFDGIYNMLRTMGFVLRGTEDILRHPKNGRILQCDSIFYKEH